MAKSITQNKAYNSYKWDGLTKGKLLCIAIALAGYHHDANNPIAYDCYREITNYLYETDQDQYKYVTERCNLR